MIPILSIEYPRPYIFGQVALEHSSKPIIFAHFPVARERVASWSVLHPRWPGQARHKQISRNTLCVTCGARERGMDLLSLSKRSYQTHIRPIVPRDDRLAVGGEGEAVGDVGELVSPGWFAVGEVPDDEV